MKNKTHHRRNFLKTAGLTLGAALAGCRRSGNNTRRPYAPSPRLEQFRRILETPVLKKDHLRSPIVIRSVELLQSGKHYFTRVTSEDGAAGYALNTKKYITNIYPIILNRIAPIVAGKDARDLERIIDRDVYIGKLNYKWQGLAFWVGVAYVELAVLDLLGRISGQPIGALLGGRVREEVAIYYASGNRGNRPEAEVEHLQSLIEKSGARAVKYRLGARMRYDAASTRRDKALIPLVRQALGDDATIYTDANGSYDVAMAIEIGRILEAYGTDFFEEPCPFDHYEETQAVANALDVPIAGGEEEVSMRQFMWLLDHEILSIVQPDLLFFGGLIRSIRIARMAHALGMPCTPHISGSGMGFLNMLHFASCVPNIGPYQEYKGDKDRYPVHAPDVPLKPVDGKIRVPRGPGLGITFEPAFLDAATAIRSI